MALTVSKSGLVSMSDLVSLSGVVLDAVVNTFSTVVVVVVTVVDTAAINIRYQTCHDSPLTELMLT